MYCFGTKLLALAPMDKTCGDIDIISKYSKLLSYARSHNSTVLCILILNYFLSETIIILTEHTIANGTERLTSALRLAYWRN